MGRISFLCVVTLLIEAATSQNIGNPVNAMNNNGYLRSNIANGLTGPNFSNISPNLSNKGPNINIAGPSIDSFGPNFNIAGPSIGSLGTNMNITGPNFNIAGPKMNIAGPNMNIAGPNIGGIGPNFNIAGPNIGSLGTNLNIAGPNIGNIGPNFSRSIRPGLSNPALIGAALANPTLPTGPLSRSFQVSSSSPVPATGISVLAENLAIEGPVNVGGQLPFLGTVGIEGALPSTGSGVVSYGCGGNVGINSEATLGASVGPYSLAGQSFMPGQGLSMVGQNGFVGRFD